MGSMIIETRLTAGKVLRLVSLDDKYTVYNAEFDAGKDPALLSEDDFAAIASFDTVSEAKKFLDEQ